MTTIDTATSGTVELARLKILAGLAGELRDRVAAEAEHVLSISAAGLLPAHGLDRLLIGLCTVAYGNGAPSEFLQILGYRTSGGDVVAVTETRAEVALPADAAGPLGDLLDAYAAAIDGVVDDDCAWRLLLTSDGVTHLDWAWDDHVAHDLDLLEPAPLPQATYHAMLAGELPAGSVQMTVAGRDVRVFSAAGATPLTVTVPVFAGIGRLDTLDAFHARVDEIAGEHRLAVAYSPGRRLDVLVAALCATLDTTAFADRVSELTEQAPAVTATVPVEALRQAQRALAGDLPVDLLRAAFGDLVDEMLGGAEAEQARVLTVRLAAAATPAVRDALTDLEAMAAVADKRVQVSVSADGLQVGVTVAACSLGVAQQVAREFVRFCGALRIDVAEIVSIVPAP